MTQGEKSLNPTRTHKRIFVWASSIYEKTDKNVEEYCRSKRKSEVDSLSVLINVIEIIMIGLKFIEIAFK